MTDEYEVRIAMADKMSKQEAEEESRKSSKAALS
jgi:hypothetical protein